MNKKIILIKKKFNNNHFRPICDPPCENDGECINDNTCECKNHFIGKTCSERFHMEKNMVLYIIVLIIGSFYGFITLLMIPIMVYYRNHGVIKAGNYNFYYYYYYYLNEKKKKKNQIINYIFFSIYYIIHFI